MKTLIVLAGPTGVGKTETSLSIAENYSIPIINADSRQIFYEIPIGTAAPTAEQQRRVRHYFVGDHSVTDYYSASLYETDVLRLLDTLFTKSDVAMMCGGSMMYIDAVCDGIDDMPTVDDATRELMKRRLADEGLPALVEELRTLDPDHWAIVDRNNPRRVVHALEICHCTGRTYTSFRTNTRRQRPFNIVKIGLTRQREQLYERINSRVLQMVSDGLLEEARKVYPLRELNALNTVGYKELFEHFDGVTTLDEAVTKIQGNTRRYCRKQLTWLKRDERIRWFEPTVPDGGSADNAAWNIKEIINYIENNRLV